MKKNYNMLKEKALPLTDRELSILSVAVTMLQNKGVDPYEQSLVIQVDQNLVAETTLAVKGKKKPCFHPNSINISAEDQNFERSTYVRSNCFLTPCIIPHGKYCVTGPERWNLLGGQDKTAQKKNKLFFKNLEPYDSQGI